MPNLLGHPEPRYPQAPPPARYQETYHMHLTWGSAFKIAIAQWVVSTIVVMAMLTLPFLFGLALLPLLGLTVAGG